LPGAALIETTSRIFMAYPYANDVQE
jgi:hypothetical protein